MTRIVQAAAAACFLILSACSLPVNPMSAEERQADLEWAFQVFYHNYAPAELKKTNFGVEISEVEADCLTMASEDMDNQAFLALFHRCIRMFQDAHVGAQQLNNGILPEYAQVAHLGFFTMRTKAEVDGESVDALRIVQLLKGSDGKGAPMSQGDLIVSVNDQPVKDYLSEEIIPYVNVGQDETNLTIAAYRFGVRASVDMSLPNNDEIKLKVVRGSRSFDIVLPWIQQDLLAFQLQQAPPDEKTETGEPQALAPSLELVDRSINTVEDLMSEVESGQKAEFIVGMSENSFASSFLGYPEIQRLLETLQNPIQYATERVKLIALTGFKMVRFNPVFETLFEDERLDRSLLDRSLPDAISIEDLMSNPLINAKKVTTSNGTVYAYIRLSSFPADDNILMEWFRAMTAIEDKGIKGVFIDLIDNTGGSLIHGMRMANMLRKKSLSYPSLQLRLNNNWMNSFKSQAAFSENDSQKAIAARVVRQLEEDLANGKKVSRPIPVTVLDPFFLQNPGIGVSDDVKIVLLVNEMCVSMCDIFASMIQDNNLGVIMGQRTMGGGGNVVQHGLSPVSKIGMSITESLVVTAKGKYIEDDGVIPDVEFDMVADREKGFDKAFNEAYEYIKVSNE
jgi:C-terminal processing protease CtpA/Prc